MVLPVRDIIKNANYTGDLVQSKTQTQSVTSLKRTINDPKDYIIIENCHEAIIDKKTFKLANALLNSRKKLNLNLKNIYFLIYYSVLIVEKECTLKRIEKAMFVALSIKEVLLPVTLI